MMEYINYCLRSYLLYCRSGNCTYDYLSIEEPNPNELTRTELNNLGTFCGTNSPSLISSIQVKKIMFHSS